MAGAVFGERLFRAGAAFGNDVFFPIFSVQNVSTVRFLTQIKLGSCRGNMGNNIRTKRKHTIKINQEYSQREVERESCGCKVKKCNWLRHLGGKKI